MWRTIYLLWRIDFALPFLCCLGQISQFEFWPLHFCFITPREFITQHIVNLWWRYGEQLNRAYSTTRRRVKSQVCNTNYQNWADVFHWFVYISVTTDPWGFSKTDTDQTVRESLGGAHVQISFVDCDFTGDVWVVFVRVL